MNIPFSDTVGKSKISHHIIISFFVPKVNEKMNIFQKK